MTKAVRGGEARLYEDDKGADGFLRYGYRGTDAAHRDNVGLRPAMRRSVPLAHLFAITPALTVEVRLDILSEGQGPSPAW